LHEPEKPKGQGDSMHGPGLENLESGSETPLLLFFKTWHGIARYIRESEVLILKTFYYAATG
jgi:hypothetical protein